MAERDQIVSYCDRLLDVAAFRDYGPNGLQVPGSREVDKVATAVSAHLGSIEAAVASGAQMLLTHHGLFWDFHPRALSEQMAARLKVALDAGLSVAGYHLPLDAHPEIGNNALLCRMVGFEPDGRTIGNAKGRDVGIVGRISDPMPMGELTAVVEAALGREPVVFADGPDEVGTIGIVSGSAASDIHTAVAMGLDAYLTGEPAEHAMADAREGRINFFAAGHYATEVAGIRRLGEQVADEFDIEHEFLELPNPI